MSFSGDNVPNLRSIHIAIHPSHYANKLVPDDYWNSDCSFCPGTPIPNIHIGTTNRRLVNSYQNIVDAKFGDWHLLQP
jgi:hypothetical protein